MKKFLTAALCLFAALSFWACSAPEEEETGRIEQFTDEVARDATDAIQRPLDKARNVRELSRQRNDDLEQD
jgi:hypothetical protein